MKNMETEPIVLKDGAKVFILGGGPSGAFFAIHLLREISRTGKKIDVTIIDKRITQTFGTTVAEPRGCNLCAGIISPRLLKEFKNYNIKLPETVICQYFSHIWIHGMWKNFPLKIPYGYHMISVFRGTLPVRRPHGIQGFDAFLLNTAVKRGARLLNAEALEIRYNRRQKPCLILQEETRAPLTLDADFILISPGVNANRQIRDNRIFNSFRKINPEFSPPKTRPALIFELKPGARYLKKVMDKEMFLLISGSKKIDLDHAALIPKKDYLTVALTGKSIDRANLPEDTMNLIKAFMDLKSVRNILPGISLSNTPVVCSCTPLMAVMPAKKPYATRIGLLGDALGARLFRDGIFSGFIQARSLARAIIRNGVDEASLSPVYDEIGHWLKQDNVYGKRVMGLIQTALKFPLSCRILYQTFATEMKFKTMEQWPMGRILWKIGSGAGDYREIFWEICSWKVLGSILRGTGKTLRNIMTEIFFGLKWGNYGRYPTVIIKEKREYIKNSIEKPLEIKLDKNPEMERMYAIKIRASARTIFKELGRFGEKKSRFLRLRFVNVKRIKGAANQIDAIVQYSLKILPVSMDIHLIQAIKDQTLLYKPDELFAENGILLFDISPTKDGNNRLVIYTAFDFKKGNTFFGKVIFKLFRYLFPDYAHDVVWNHAVCSIKAQAESSFESENS